MDVTHQIVVMIIPILRRQTTVLHPHHRRLEEAGIHHTNQTEAGNPKVVNILILLIQTVILIIGRIFFCIFYGTVHKLLFFHIHIIIITCIFILLYVTFIQFAFYIYLVGLNNLNID